PALLRGRPPSALTIPQRLNLYAYSTNNPYRYIDPDGQYTIAIQGFSSSGLSNLFGPSGIVTLAGSLKREINERTALFQHDDNIATMIADIKANKGDEPLNIIGHSLGGITAKNLARELATEGITV